MKTLALAIGHGVTPKGVDDPGAVAPGAEHTEHEEATFITAHVNHLLKSTDEFDLGELGWRVEWEGDLPADPNYVGTTKWANDLPADAVVSVHLDWHKAPVGGFGLYLTDDGAAIANHIWRAYVEAGLTTRDHQERQDLYLLRNTDAPALIWEADKVGDHVDPVDTATAITKGLYAYCAANAAPHGVDEPERPPEPSPWSASIDAPDLIRRGAKGYPVQMIHHLLGANGYAHLLRDELGTQQYGRHTEDAVSAYQAHHDLGVDGIVGPETFGHFLTLDRT